MRRTWYIPPHFPIIKNILFKLGLGWLSEQTGFDVADPTRMSRAGSRRPAASRSSPSPAAPGGNDPGNSVLKYQWYDFYVERKRSILLGKNYVGSSFFWKVGSRSGFFLEGRIRVNSPGFEILVYVWLKLNILKPDFGFPVKNIVQAHLFDIWGICIGNF